MRTIRFSYFISLIISLFFIAKPLFPASLSQAEMSYIIHNQDTKHIYCGSDSSNLIELAHQISLLDTDKDSLLHQFCAHVERGFRMAKHTSVVQMLEQALSVLENANPEDITDEKELIEQLYSLIDQVVSGDLLINVVDDIDVPSKKVISLPASLDTLAVDSHPYSLFSSSPAAERAPRPTDEAWLSRRGCRGR